MGAYEYGSAPTPPAPETATNGVPVTWLQAYGFSSNWDAAAMSDLDGDGLLAWQEWLAGTDPNSKTSVLQVVNFAGTNGQWAVAFDSVTGNLYSIIQCGNLMTNAGGWVSSGVDVTGTGTRLTMPSPAYSPTSTFFRVKVQTLP